MRTRYPGENRNGVDGLPKKDHYNDRQGGKKKSVYPCYPFRVHRYTGKSPEKSIPAGGDYQGWHHGMANPLDFYWVFTHYCFTFTLLKRLKSHSFSGKS